MKQKIGSASEVSAYLDGKLDHSDQVTFEAQMAQDPALRRRVDEMRQIVDMVRAVPLREPPRNYLLSPSMVTEAKRTSERQRAPLFVMRLATSLVALAFVVTFGLGLLQSGMTPVMVMESREMQQLEMPREEAVADEIVADAEVPEQEAEAPVMKAVEVEVEAETVVTLPTREVEGTMVPQAEIALEPTPPSDDTENGAGESGEALGIGGGGAAPPEGESETIDMAQAPLAPEEATEPTALVEAPAEELQVEPTTAAPEESAEPVAMVEAPAGELPVEPTVAALEEMDDSAQPVERAIAPDVESPSSVIGTDEVAVSPEAEVEPWGETVETSQSTPIFQLALGLGIATLLMAAITYWLSRRTLG